MNALAGIALSVLAVAASPDAKQNAAAATDVRSARELRQAVDRLVAAEAAATTTSERAAAIREMAALSREIAVHPTLGKHAAASMRDRLAGRLNRAAAELRANATAAAKAPPKVAGPTADAAVLGQVGGGFPFGPPAEAGGIDGADALAELFEETVAPESWERVGGPGVIRVFPGGDGGDLLAQVQGQGGNFAGAAAPLALDNDQSEELIALIQEVVAPQSWDVNGGAGAAMFFKPKNALVVRQTEEVHEGLFDVVNQLRRKP